MVSTYSGPSDRRFGGHSRIDRDATGGIIAAKSLLDVPGLTQLWEMRGILTDPRGIMAGGQASQDAQIQGLKDLVMTPEGHGTLAVDLFLILLTKKFTVAAETDVVSLHRPYLRNWVVNEVEANAFKTADGKFIDPNTLLPTDHPVIGHKPGYEFWRLKAAAEAEGVSQELFNETLNNPEFYQLKIGHRTPVTHSNRNDLLKVAGSPRRSGTTGRVIRSEIDRHAG